MTQWLLVLGALVWSGLFPVAIAQLPVTDVATAIRAAVHDSLTSTFPLTSVMRDELTVLYRTGDYHPLWVDEAGRPTANARDALALLTGAANEGLDPAHYRTSILDSWAATLDGAPVSAASSIAAFDTGLSASTLRYLRDLHIGRIDPRAIGFRMMTPAHNHDFAALLRTALVDHRVPELAVELTPPFELYRGLRTLLARYRDLAADSLFQMVPVPGIDPDSSSLHRLLVALGDLPGETPASAASSVDEGALVGAIKHFQRRHGLETDGIIGARTLAALRVPLAWRARQIELALERLRWLPHLDQDRLLAVNIPMFRLWVWESPSPNDTRASVPSFEMDVIVGRALDRQTPVFVDQMEYIIFRPYWNVPTSILRAEILPALAREPSYLRQQDMEIVSGPGDHPRVIPLTKESLEQLQNGQLRVRQRPGPRNSLGLVKFVFPNDMSVYLHGTPAPELFSRSRRDFSHGCVRVEDPVALAEWALKDQEEWNRDRILAAMNAGGPHRVNLRRPIQVILFYITAVVMPEDGSIHFAQDIYGHDAKLDRALERFALAQ